MQNQFGNFWATGVVSLPSETEVFAPALDEPGESRRFLKATDLGEVIDVVSVKDGCVVELADALIAPDSGVMQSPFPATMMNKLLFSSQQLADDWAGRSKNFPGLGPLPAIEARDGLKFNEVELPESGEEVMQEAAVHDDVLQRLAGGIVTLLSSSNTGSRWMPELAANAVLDRQLFIHLLSNSFGLEPVLH